MLQSPCFLRMTQSEGLAAEIATAAARNDNWVFVPAIEYFDVFAEPLECNNIMKLRCTKTTLAFLYTRLATLRNLRYYKVTVVKWKYTYQYTLNCCPIPGDSGSVRGTIYSPVTGKEVQGETRVHPVMDDMTIKVPLRRDKDGNIIPPENLIPYELASQLKGVWRHAASHATRALIRRGVPVSRRLVDSQWRQS